MKQVWCFCLLLLFCNVNAQDAGAPDELQQKAQRWVGGLKLDDKIKAGKVQQAIVAHLTAVRDWHNSHPFTQVPAGINPATGNKLSDLDRQLIVCSSKPAAIHTTLMEVLQAELNAEQVAFILDQYTVGKVAFTLKGYEAIVPDLTEKERTEIRKNLEQAREQAIDYKSMKEISAIFEIYKTKCEQYLNNNGRNWRQLFKTYVEKVKAEKEKKKSGAL
ncbi:DUF3826 domain-containing protein [Niabella sp.]|uniref:DUF3826 domain-containing protein n=1 Tax=Niabella sp. TaxID=1962976 RepID=UPI0026216532|nr:DUF3826 domain-containing protein [Niabella sp.]